LWFFLFPRLVCLCDGSERGREKLPGKSFLYLKQFQFALDPLCLADSRLARRYRKWKNLIKETSPTPPKRIPHTEFLPKIRITCQEEIEKECGFIETFVFRFTAVAALARRMRLPFYRLYV
jgi:hypothetical protein